MRQRNRLYAVAVVSFLTLGLAAQAQDDSAAPASPDSQQAIKIAAHSSRWDYPRETTPGQGQQIHVVVKGDTLWDLGNKYLGNPFAWPQIWELNKWVKDPHWIYPGDPILVDASRGTVLQQRDQNLAPGEVANLMPDYKLTPKPSLAEYGYSFQDFIQMPYLVSGTAEAHMKQVGAFKIVGQEDEVKTMLSDGDVVYIDGGSNQGVKAGDRLVITTIAERKFYHPDDRNHRVPLGDILAQCGVVRVTRVYATQAVAVIERALDGVTKGGYVAPYLEPAAIVNKLRTDIASPVRFRQPTCKIIYIRESQPVAAGGDLAILDRGTSDGYKVGDVLLSARAVQLDVTQTGPDGNVSNNYLGQVLVIQASEHSSTCRILRSNEELQIGDILTH